jgi:hypothetical protein
VINCSVVSCEKAPEISSATGRRNPVPVLSNDSVTVGSRQPRRVDLSEDAVIVSLEDIVFHGLKPVVTKQRSLSQEPLMIEAVFEIVLQELEVNEKTCAHNLCALPMKMIERKLVEIRDGQTA